MTGNLHPKGINWANGPGGSGLRWSWGLIGLLLCLGCGGEDWHASTHPARGQLTINGQPAAGAVVELHSTGEAADVRNSRPWAVVQEDGSFSLSTYEKGDGAPVGDYAVTLRWPPDVTQPSLADRLGGAYTKPGNSTWKVTITEGDNELPPIEVKNARVQSAERAGAPRRAPPVPGMQPN